MPRSVARTREPAAQRQRLHHDHVRLQPIGAGALHFAVDVEHRGALDEDGVAVLDLDVGLGVAAAEDPRQVDGPRYRLAVALRQHRHRVGARGADAARQCQDVGQARAGVLEHIGARAQQLPEHVHLPAAHLHDGDGDLRLDHEAAAAQLIGDAVSRLRRRQPAQFDLAHQREHDGAPRGDAGVGREVRILEHRDAHAVARAERFIRAGGVARLGMCRRRGDQC